MDKIRAYLSYLLSFHKRVQNWTIHDYPVRVRLQQSDDTGTDVPPYCAQIINWWTMTGLGDTAQDARDDLSNNFEEYKQNNSSIPRPGCFVPLEFADSSVVESDPEIYRRFITDVLGFNTDDPVFISDESSLHEFDGVNGGINLFDRTRDVFGVDVSDVPDGNLTTIFRRIQDAT